MNGKIMNSLFRIFRYLKGWKIALGKDPRHVPSHTLIVFPLIAGTLFCGLAGIITVGRKKNPEKDDIIGNLSRLFEVIRENNIGKLAEGTVSGEKYLGGDGSLRPMEGDILRLKQDSFLEDIFFEPGRSEDLKDLLNRMNDFLVNEENLLEQEAGNFSTGEMEYVNNALTLFRDCLWALEEDIFSNIEMIVSLSGEKGKETISREAFSKYRNINLLLKSLDRLEVRGRDSAGIGVTFTLKEEDALDRAIQGIKDIGLYDEWCRRIKPGDLVDGSIHVSRQRDDKGPAGISFTYKKASVTGKLGENGRYLRERIQSDRLLKIFIGEAIESEMYLGHTRWASVGSITEKNCHPINNFSIDGGRTDNSERTPAYREFPAYGKGAWTIQVALNGDIDNYGELRSHIEVSEGDVIHKSVTTDTKIIPFQIERHLYEGHRLA
jgi:glucosamine--fructose-6-phosphate aminotransferase (isomerizing)